MLGNIPERMLRKIERGGPTECWPWTGARYRNVDGKATYGEVSIRGRVVGAHRAVYALVWGPVPAGHVVRHTCDNQQCVNPLHLVSGSRADNAQDSVARGRWPRVRRRTAAERSAVVATRARKRRGVSKLTAEQAGHIKARLAAGVSGSVLARQFGVSPRSVYNIRDGKCWADVEPRT